MDYRSAPEKHGLTAAQGDALYVFYVEREMTMAESRRAVEQKLDCSITETAVSRFINANGWKRSQHYYARRSPWRGYNTSEIAESRARRRGSV